MGGGGKVPWKPETVQMGLKAKSLSQRENEARIWLLSGNSEVSHYNKYRITRRKRR